MEFMRRAIPVFIITVAAIGARAEDEIRCNPEGSQSELNACASEEFARADKELNETYQALLVKEAPDKVFVSKLRHAQKAWLAFRDADLEARFSCSMDDARICWGSMYPMLLMHRKAELTRERTRHLQQILRDGLGG